MSKEKRYVVTVDYYLYAESDQAAIDEAKRRARNMDYTKADQASVVEIGEQPFGKIGDYRKIYPSESKTDQGIFATMTPTVNKFFEMIDNITEDCKKANKL